LIEPLVFAELLALGLFIGFCAGLLGLGGGMLMVPFLMWVLEAKGVPAQHILKVAVATSLATICLTSVSSVWAHHQQRAVLWPVVWALAPGILIGGLAGARLAVAMPTRVMMVLFALFMAYTATQLFLNKKPRPGRRLPGQLGMFGMGNVIGGLSSMLGAGGAFISVPFLTACHVAIHQAVATSAALGFPIALAGTIGYIWAGLRVAHELPAGSVGFLYLPGLVALALGSIFTAPLGARTAHRMDVAPLKKVFAVFLYGMALYFLMR
jgi:uncharacterized membrane protein YfcA